MEVSTTSTNTGSIIATFSNGASIDLKRGTRIPLSNSGINVENTMLIYLTKNYKVSSNVIVTSAITTESLIQTGALFSGILLSPG